MVLTAPSWARLFARGEVTATDLRMPPPPRDYARQTFFVWDENAPSTRVELHPALWNQVCTACGWPMTLPSEEGTHPACDVVPSAREVARTRHA